jgi:hypothetical protein
MKRFSLLLLYIVVFAGIKSAEAQTLPAFERVTGVLKTLRDGYGKDPFSFDLKYIYANEHTPGKILDSLTGRIETDGTNYHSLLDNTETIHNEKYNIVLFKEDQIMYLSTGATAAASVDPLAQMETVLKQSGATSCTILKSGKNNIINIGFAPDGPCKKMEITIDTVAHRLISMEYVVKTALLTETPDDNDKAATEGYDEYAIVRASFYNYKALNPDSSRFDDRTFFYKEGTEFKTTAAYNNYKIFVATPNL